MRSAEGVDKDTPANRNETQDLNLNKSTREGADGPGQQVQNLTTGLAALYIASVGTHFLIQPFLRIGLVVAMGSVTLASLYLLRWWLSKQDSISPRTLESAGSLVAVLSLLNAAGHLYILSDLSKPTNPALFGIGLLCFFLSTQRLSLVLSSTLGVFLIVVTLSNPTEAWLYFTFGLLMASGLRLHSEFSRLRLRMALASAEQETLRRKTIQNKLSESEQRFARAAEASQGGIWDLNLRTSELYTSERWIEMSGASVPQEVDTLQKWVSYVHPDDLSLFETEFESVRNGSIPKLKFDYRLKQGESKYVWVQLHGLCVEGDDGVPVRITGSQVDITSQREAEEQLYYRAVHDPLTDLYNRRLFLDRLDSTLGRAQTSDNSKLAVLFVDLDHFKVINDTLGHIEGDRILQLVADRLRNNLPEVDMLARFGGDEFVVLLDPVTNLEDVSETARRVLKIVCEPVYVAGREVTVGASIGVAVGPSGYETSEKILGDADKAMFRAKNSTTSRIIFASELTPETPTTVRSFDTVNQAIEENRLLLRFEPIVSLTTSSIEGVEPTVHLKDHDNGTLPVNLSRISSKNGLEAALTAWTLKSTNELISGWDSKGPHLITVNVSARWLKSALDAGAFERTKIDPRITLEIPESSVPEFLRASDGNVRALKNGRSWGIDHYGVGRASMTDLKVFPSEIAKIDGSWVRGLENYENEVQRKMVRVMVKLMKDLGREVVALGVENLEQLEILREIGCTYGQGPFFSGPVSFETIEELLKTEPRRHKDLDKPDLQVAAAG